MKDVEIDEERGNPTVGSLSEDEQYEEYKREKRIKEAQKDTLKIEYDLFADYLDKAFIKETCKTANASGIGALVVYPNFVKSFVNYLGKDPQVSLIAAISAPHGEDTTDIKVKAVKCMVGEGVDEVEVYAPMSKIRDGNWAYLKRECKKLKKAGKSRAVRLVLNCENVNEKELLRAANIAADRGISCLRLNNAAPQTLSTVKEAMNGRCRVKADKTENRAQFMNVCAVGADYAACTNPFDLAVELITAAEK